MLKNSFTIHHLRGDVIRDNETYEVEDRKFDHLTVSKTTLHQGKQTTGHSHNDIEEVYIFVRGEGLIYLEENEKKYTNLNVRGGSIVRIPPGQFHKVENTGKGDLIFICVFENYR